MPNVAIPESLVAALRDARRVVVLTGAGVSAESGVPTFRDAQTGLWAKYDPHELATPEAFQRNPKLVWEWYAWRREMVGGVEPNPGHVALAELEFLVPDLVLVTQNVDGLHRRAGSRRVLELHGDITRVKCFDCDAPAARWADEPVPPPCALCGGPLRPDVVWFGEMLPLRELEQAMEAARLADVFLSVGTSALVYPAAALPEVALQGGAVVVEINSAATALTPHCAHSLRGASGVVLPALVAALRGG
ncbi:MAG TPA: NAD-dependent deacylase [Pelomicrobium sp.]|nr:NAD-dependent deacylase [Pelomicrobium sp.]